MLAAGAHAFLRRRRPRVLPLFQPQKHVLELVHPRIRKQQGSVPMRHQRRAPHPPVPLALKKAQEPFADLVPAPNFLAYRFARHVRLSFAGFNPQIIADTADPRNEPRVAQSCLPLYTLKAKMLNAVTQEVLAFTSSGTYAPIAESH